MTEMPHTHTPLPPCLPMPAETPPEEHFFTGNVFELWSELQKFTAVCEIFYFTYFKPVSC